ncbi:MAG TPA: hypothetical protein VIM13_00640 [Clostridia bacterium]
MSYLDFRRNEEAGDLFSPVSDAKYDLIIFNAPWVKAPAKNRAELALSDKRHETIRRSPGRTEY